MYNTFSIEWNISKMYCCPLLHLQFDESNLYLIHENSPLSKRIDKMFCLLEKSKFQVHVSTLFKFETSRMVNKQIALQL